MKWVAVEPRAQVTTRVLAGWPFTPKTTLEDLLIGKPPSSAAFCGRGAPLDWGPDCSIAALEGRAAKHAPTAVRSVSSSVATASRRSRAWSACVPVPSAPFACGLGARARCCTRRGRSSSARATQMQRLDAEFYSPVDKSPLVRWEITGHSREAPPRVDAVTSGRTTRRGSRRPRALHVVLLPRRLTRRRRRRAPHAARRAGARVN